MFARENYCTTSNLDGGTLLLNIFLLDKDAVWTTFANTVQSELRFVGEEGGSIVAAGLL